MVSGNNPARSISQSARTVATARRGRPALSLRASGLGNCPPAVDVGDGCVSYREQDRRWLMNG